MSIIIRPFSEKDLLEVAELHFHSYHFQAAEYRRHELQYFPLEKFQKNWQDFCENKNGRIALVATDGNKIVGLARYSPRIEKPNTDKWLITHSELLDKALSSPQLAQYNQVYIMPEYIQHKLGARLSLIGFEDMVNVGAEYALTERNAMNTPSAMFQKKSYLAEDVATCPDLDIKKGEYGAPRDIWSTSIMSVVTVRNAVENLRKRIENTRD